MVRRRRERTGRELFFIQLTLVAFITLFDCYTPGTMLTYSTYHFVIHRVMIIPTLKARKLGPRV